MARMTLDLPDELVSELERRADKSGASVADFIRRTLCEVVCETRVRG